MLQRGFETQVNTICLTISTISIIVSTTTVTLTVRTYEEAIMALKDLPSKMLEKLTEDPFDEVDISSVWSVVRYYWPYWLAAVIAMFLILSGSPLLVVLGVVPLLVYLYGLMWLGRGLVESVHELAASSMQVFSPPRDKR